MRLVADNLQPMNPMVQKALKNRDSLFFRDLAQKARKAGAHALDVNPGPMGKKGPETMAFLVNTLTAGCGLPLFIDTPDPQAMEAGLERAGKAAVLNGVSPQPGRLEAMLPLARKFKVDLVGFLLTSEGRVCPDATSRLEAAGILVEKAREAGVDPNRFIFDPVLVPLTWENGPDQVRAVLETLTLLPDLLGGPVRTMAGLSNLISGAGPSGPKRLMEQTVVSMLAARGLTHLLLNIHHESSVAAARACKAVLRPGVFTWEELEGPDPSQDSIPECRFCYPNIKNRIIREHGSMVAIKDAFPVTPGHVLVIPKRHVPEYFDLTDGERRDADNLLKFLKQKICQKDSTVTGYNIGLNNGKSAGQTIFHVHFHLIPRRDGDTQNPRGGVRGVIPGKRSYEPITSTTANKIIFNFSIAINIIISGAGEF